MPRTRTAKNIEIMDSHLLRDALLSSAAFGNPSVAAESLVYKAKIAVGTDDLVLGRALLQIAAEKYMDAAISQGTITARVGTDYSEILGQAIRDHKSGKHVGFDYTVHFASLASNVQDLALGLNQIVLGDRNPEQAATLQKDLADEFIKESKATVAKLKADGFRLTRQD